MTAEREARLLRYRNRMVSALAGLCRDLLADLNAAASIRADRMHQAGRKRRGETVSVHRQGKPKPRRPADVRAIARSAYLAAGAPRAASTWTPEDGWLVPRPAPVEPGSRVADPVPAEHGDEHHGSIVPTAKQQRKLEETWGYRYVRVSSGPGREYGRRLEGIRRGR